jgi:hypothetical protein
MTWDAVAVVFTILSSVAAGIVVLVRHATQVEAKLDNVAHAVEGGFERNSEDHAAIGVRIDKNTAEIADLKARSGE